MEEGRNVYVLPQNGSLVRCLYFLFTKILRGVWHWSFYKKSVYLNLVPLPGLRRLVKRLRPDVIHIHWLNTDVLNYEQLASLKTEVLGCRFVVNLHDLFMINAIEPHPRGDLRYQMGFERKNARWLERWLFIRKKRTIDKLNPVFIAPSSWAATCCQQSLIGRNHPVFVISNLVDTNIFFFRGNVLRHRKYRVLYGAAGGRLNPQKGFDDLRRALHLLPNFLKKELELQIFGEMSSEVEIEGISVKFWGVVRDPNQMAAIYRQADVFAFPSHEETQGMVKVEAMLCGLPVIAFDQTACAEGIKHMVTGWIASSGNIKSFANGLEWAYKQFAGEASSSIRLEIARKTLHNVNMCNILSRIMGVYREKSNAWC